MCAEKCVASQIFLYVVNACEGAHRRSLLGEGREEYPHTYTGCCVGPRCGLDILEKKKVSGPGKK